MELNEAKLIERELTLRNLRMTKEVTETRRSMARWLALSLGVISPGESRLKAVPVLDAMLHFQFRERRDPDVRELSDYIGRNWGEINEKTLRYHLLQLKHASIISNSKGKYYMTKPDVGDRYDSDAWLSHYLDGQVNPIRDKLQAAIKRLGSR